MRMTICRSSVIVLIAGALVAPASLVAQSPDPGSLRTHVVRPGDTLWELAERYLGSGYRWREILTVNARLVGGPRQLEVGQTLRIPRPGAISRQAPRGTARPAPRIDIADLVSLRTVPARFEQLDNAGGALRLSAGRRRYLTDRCSEVGDILHALTRGGAQGVVRT